MFIFIFSSFIETLLTIPYITLKCTIWGLETYVHAYAKSLQPCPTLCNSMDFACQATCISCGSWIAGGFSTTDSPGKARKSSLQCLSWQRLIKRLQKQWLHLQRKAWLLQNSASLADRLSSQLLAVWPCWRPSSTTQSLAFTKPVRQRVKQYHLF